MPKYTVFSDLVEIDAPVDIVWEILLDLDKYGEWNPFTYRVDSSLEIGSPVDLYVHMPIRGDRIQKEVVRIIDKPNKLAWGMKIGFEFFLKALREQEIKKITDKRCSYQTWDAFSGILTPVTIKLFEEDMRNGFNAAAYALKDRAEETWQAKPK